MLELRNDSADSVPESCLEEVADLVFSRERIPSTRIVSVLITGDATTRETNRRYRGVDRTTDVLSFPVDFPGSDELGDILINVDEVRRTGNDFREEIRILFLHGLLHLLGYDHIAAEDARIMNGKQTEYLEALTHRE